MKHRFTLESAKPDPKVTFRALIVSLSVVGLSQAVAVSAHAECVTPGAWLLKEPSVELVFAGTVLEIDRASDVGVRITFDIDRVWKGAAAHRFSLYEWELDSEMPAFQTGRQYVVFATKMDARSRKGVELNQDGGTAFKPVQCGALAYQAAQEAGTIGALGAGRRPK